LKIYYTIIKPLLLTGSNKISRWFSYIGLGLGVLLLLSSLQLFININQMLNKSDIRKNGYDFVPVSKMITNDNMGKDNHFDAADINELKAQPFIDDAAALTPNTFQVTAEAGDMIPFSSDIFLEAINSNFIDTVPKDFTWREGQETVPVIFSSDFLEMYNVFAPGWNLPQISPETASNVRIYLRCKGKLEEKVFRANIVAFSDRINSMLVPENFLNWANKTFDGIDSVKPSRIFIKTKDINNKALIKFLEQKKYRVNKEKTIFGRSRQVLQGIVSGLGFFGLIVIVLALMLFSFYLQLVIARSKDNLQLLLTLGYSPSWLSKKLAAQFIPVYISVMLIALAFTQILHWAFVHFIMHDKPGLSFFVQWSVPTAAAFLILLSLVINYQMVKKLLYKMF
jgi:hypothetical protein